MPTAFPARPSHSRRSGKQRCDRTALPARLPPRTTGLPSLRVKASVLLGRELQVPHRRRRDREAGDRGEPEEERPPLPRREQLRVRRHAPEETTSARALDTSNSAASSSSFFAASWRPSSIRSAAKSPSNKR